MNRSASDIEAGRQILNIFVRSKVPAGGELRRIHFFDVRDGDFQRGIDCALMNRWIALHHRDRYRYILTAEGYAAGRQTDSPATVPSTPQAATPQATSQATTQAMTQAMTQATATPTKVEG